DTLLPSSHASSLVRSPSPHPGGIPPSGRTTGVFGPPSVTPPVPPPGVPPASRLTLAHPAVTATTALTPNKMIFTLIVTRNARGVARGSPRPARDRLPSLRSDQRRVGDEESVVSKTMGPFPPAPPAGSEPVSMRIVICRSPT